MKPEDYLISFNDILRILRRRKKTLLFSALAFSFFFSFFALKKPAQYLAKASFRETSRTQPQEPGVAKLLLGEPPEKTSHTRSTMSSQTLLGKVVKHHNLQGHLVETPPFFSRWIDNCQIELSHCLHKDHFNQLSPDPLLTLSALSYDGNVKIPLTLTFLDPVTFSVKGPYGTIGEGAVGTPFKTDFFSFTLSPLSNENLSGRTFSLILLSLDQGTQKLRDSLTLKEDFDDTTLLLLSLKSQDREEGIAILNTLMEEYRSLLKEKRDLVSADQLVYLQKRQREMQSSLKKAMIEHAEASSEDLSKSGFFETQKELDSLFEQRHNLLKKLRDTEVDITHLETFSLSSDHENNVALNLPTLNPLIDQRRSLKGEKNHLLFSLKNHTSSEEKDLNQEGLTYEGAHDLYFSLIEEIALLDSGLDEKTFVLSQLDNPDFQLTTLSTTLNDPISQEIIKSASECARELAEPDKYTQKELDRLGNDLLVQKNYLKSHLRDTQKTHSLYQEQLFARRASLERRLLRLTEDKITLTEEMINEALMAHLSFLKSQKERHQGEIASLQTQMAFLPNKWVSEQLIKQDVDLNRAIVEEITKLSESTTIDHHLDLIESAPLDLAHSPPLPVSPRLFLMATVGFVSGGVLSAIALIVSLLMRGIPASSFNLSLFSQIAISPPDIERKLSLFIDRLQDRELLLLKFPGETIEKLTKTLHARGKKVLIVDLPSQNSEETPTGLLPVLLEKLSFPHIENGHHSDKIVAGGYDPLAAERLGSFQGKILRNEFLDLYDLVIFAGPLVPSSSESLVLSEIFSSAVYLADDELFSSLIPLFTPNRAFVFNQY